MPEIANPYNNPSLKRPRGGNLKGTPLQGAKVATVQHFVVLGCEKCRQYNTLWSPATKSTDSTTLCSSRPRKLRGARNCKSVQQPFFGKAPGKQREGDPPSGGQSCDRTALCDPRLTKSSDNTALCGPRLQKVATVQHFVVLGHKN